MNKVLYPLFPCAIDVIDKSRNQLDENPGTNSNRSMISISPLEPGLGLTIGNLIRRILIRFSPGTSITTAWIAGIEHELSSLKGVQENLSEILMKFQKISLRMNHYGPGRIFLKKEGPAIVTTDDFLLSPGIKIFEKSMYLFTLDSNASIFMILNVENGKGGFENPNHRLLNYKKQFLDPFFKSNLKDLNNLGTTVMVPHQFGTIRRVNYEVRSFNYYDELIFDVETNGSLSALEAFDSSFSFFLQKFMQIQIENSFSIKKTILYSNNS